MKKKNKKNLIIVEENWESYEYYVDGKEVKPSLICKVKIRGKVFDVKKFEYWVPYDDMGHAYHARRTDLLIKMHDGIGIKLERSLFDLQKYGVEWCRE